MNRKYDLLGIFLAGAMGLSLFIAMLLRAFLPQIILPRLDGLNIIVLSLVALVLDWYLNKDRHRNYWVMPIYAILIFGLLPWVACFLTGLEALKTAVLGGAVFTVVTFAFDSMTNRLSSGPIAKAAPAISALGLYLAAQGIAGIL